MRSAIASNSHCSSENSGAADIRVPSEIYLDGRFERAVLWMHQMECLAKCFVDFLVAHLVAPKKGAHQVKRFLPIAYARASMMRGYDGNESCVDTRGLKSAS